MQKQEQGLVVVNGVSPALVKEYRGDYILSIAGGREIQLKRDSDFGKPTEKLKKPILYKGGAEKILWDYGVIDKYEIQHCIEDFESGFFFYRIKCSLIKIIDGVEFVVKEGFGSANTRESNVGTASGFDVANTKLKIAEKRAMVDAVIKLARLSSIFTQDIENDDFMQGATNLTGDAPESNITSKQRQRIFALANAKGLSTEQTRVWLKAQGFASTKDIKQKDYDKLCEQIGEMEDAK